MKKKVNYNIDIKVLNDFTELAKNKAVNKSQLIENFIKEWILKNK